MTLQKAVEPTPVAMAIVDALGFMGAIFAIPALIIIVGAPIVFFARFVIWLVGLAFGG